MAEPRHYSGAVDFLDVAKAAAEDWPDEVLAGVMAAFPYDHHPSHVRMEDWVELVSHVSLRKEADPVATAERLALYVTTYREVHHRTLHPTTVKETQTHELPADAPA